MHTPYIGTLLKSFPSFGVRAAHGFPSSQRCLGSWPYIFLPSFHSSQDRARLYQRQRATSSPAGSRQRATRSRPPHQATPFSLPAANGWPTRRTPHRDKPANYLLLKPRKLPINLPTRVTHSRKDLRCVHYFTVFNFKSSVEICIVNNRCFVAFFFFKFKYLGVLSTSIESDGCFCSQVSTGDS